MTWVPPGPALLFCPADQPARYAKALDRADGVILDLEDAVAPANRPTARDAILATPLDPERAIVRVNPSGTRDHDADVATVAHTGYRCVMLAKTESGEQVRGLATVLGVSVLALVETPSGVVRAADIAAADGCAGLMWGAEDLVAAMGGATSRFTSAEARPGGYRDVPRHARASVALAAAAFGRWAVDAVHLDIADAEGLRAEAVDAVALGYAATACIHPSQVPIVREAYAPPPDEIAWADRVLAAARENPGVFRLDGRMIDGPLLRQAESILRRAAAGGPARRLPPAGSRG